MALTEKDIATLAKGMGPAIKDAIAEQIRPLAARLMALEQGTPTPVKMGGLSDAALEAIVGGITEAVIAEVNKKIAGVTARVAEAEAKSIGPYHGVWQPGFYGKGALVTWGGSMYVAMIGTSAKPGEKGEDSRAWVLAVKRGTDGRDGKDAA